MVLPDEVSKILEEARGLAAEGRVDGVVSCYKRIVKIEPHRADICVLLGDANAGRGQLNNAVADYLMGAKLYVQRGATIETIGVYRKVLVLTPHNISVRLRVADLLLAEGATDDAIGQYLQLAEEYKRQQRDVEAQAIHELIRKHSPGHPKAANERLPIPEESVLETTPDLEMIILDEGKILDVSIVNEGSLAVEESNEMVESQPAAPSVEFQDEFEARYELALAYKEMGLVDEAIEAFEQALRGPNRFLDSCTMIATCYKDRGLNRAAIEWLERAASHPQCEGVLALSVKFALAQLYEIEGDAAKAAHLYSAIPVIRRAADRLTAAESRSGEAGSSSADTASS